jgi:hypothetical protein
MHRIRPRHIVATMTVGVSALVVACVPAPGPGTTTTTTTIATPTPPSIDSFVIKGGVGPAPSLVALAWTATDPNGDELTCSIDGDGDGIDDIVVEDCGGTTSRNVEFADPGTRTARLTVQDSTFAPVVATRVIDVPTGTIETFDIELRGVGGLTVDQAAAFTQAEAYWESAIVRGIADFPTVPRPPCLPAGSADLPAVVDDLVIDVGIGPIDGAGSILGQAGPTCFSTGNDLPLHGVMEFDTADVANLLTDGSFDEVILHEMAHVLGIGTMWDTTLFGGARKVISGAGGPYPSFTGGRGVAEYSSLGAAGNVPVENVGGPGTRDAHWRETTFANELMTGYLNSGSNPVSRLTIASLADLGYQVTLGVAQPYSLPGGLAGLRATSADLGGTMLRPVPAPT